MSVPIRCRSVSILAAAGAVLAACSSLEWGPGPEQQPPVRHFLPQPPTAPELPPFVAPAVATDDVVDDYHGTTVADPYRWLEDQDGERTRAFVQAQNAATDTFLAALPQRAEIHARLQQLWNFPRTSAPQRFGRTWFWSHNDGLQNQGVWYRGVAPDAVGTVVLDPNSWSADGSTALAGFRPSEDGRHVAYAIAERGSDWQQWRVLDVASGALLPDTLRWAKFTAAQWSHDGKGFFYQRFPAPADGEVYQATNRNPQLCYHALGTDQAEDVVVYERPDQPDWLFGAEVSDDGRFLVLTMRSGSSHHTRLACADLQQPGWPVQTLALPGEAHWSFVGNAGDIFWLRTDAGAPMAKLVAVDRRTADAEPRTIIAERAHALQGVERCGGAFLCTWIVDAAHQVTVHGDDGAERSTVPLPTLGSVSAVLGRHDDPQVYLTFQSFVHAPTVLRHDLDSGSTTTFRRSQLPVDTDGLVTERKFLHSRDGTRLCLFLVHHRELVADATHPTYLYGYGGFAQSMTPTFSVQNLEFIERGGIYAHAILRGGGEYGDAWHRDGMLAHKQNVFDDFVACAEYLLRNRYTCRQKLAIGGRSNGGLLVGAALTQRPELFAAAIPEVGVLDMLRYHHFTIGRAWAPEFGRSDDAEAFRWLRAYSPLHRIQAGTHYPATLVMTGDHDDRVLPGHSYKFAAALQSAQAGAAPILLRVETATGHGAGKPTGKLIDEAADRWAFLAAVFGD